MVDGLSGRGAAKRFGVHRNTITKMVSFSVPPGYRRRERPASKKLGPYMAWIDAILEGGRRVHKKQRHTAHRIFERLRDEQGFTGGYTIVREYVAQAMLRTREMFVPLSHCPGHAQADFGEADGYIGGKKPQRSQAADRQRAGLCAVHGCRLLRGAVGPAHVAQREAVLQRLSCGGPNKRIKMNPARKTHSRESHTVEQQRLEVTPPHFNPGWAWGVGDTG
jgi:hypothetical protein